MDETLAFTAANAVSWNRIAALRPPKPPGFYIDGGTTLDDVELAQWPDVRGKELLHLACAAGNESLSWAARGASVTGVDISQVAVDLANQNARDTGLDAQFVTADVYQLPKSLGQFSREVGAATQETSSTPEADALSAATSCMRVHRVTTRIVNGAPHGFNKRRSKPTEDEVAELMGLQSVLLP